MLKEFEIKNAKILEGKKQAKLPDGNGLYLLITLAGAKCWRFDYRFAGLRKTLALGTYPEVTAEKARISLSAARKSLLEGLDPGKVRKEKKAKSLQSTRTFKVVAKEWQATKEDRADATKRKIIEGLALLSVELGDIPIKELRTKNFVSA